MKALVRDAIFGTAIVVFCFAATGCRTFERGVIWAPERLTYHTNGEGVVDRVEQYDANGVCRRILFFAEDGGWALVQDRDTAGVCRRATYYDDAGRVCRIEKRDTGGITRNSMRFDPSGMPVRAN